MPLKLNDLMKKAADKGFKPTESPAPLLKTWQQESVLFVSNSNDSQAETKNQQQPYNNKKSDTNRTQNLTQTEHKPNTEPDANRTQTEHKNKRKNKIEHKPNTEPDTKADTNRTQTEHKPNTKPPFSELIGLQRKFILWLFNICRNSRSKTTMPLTLEYIASSMLIRAGSVKTTIQRLQKKGIIKRIEYKNGRGGWSKYELPDDTYNEVMKYQTEHKLDTNRTQTEHKLDTELDTELDTSPSSSSSSFNYLNTTTTGDTEKIQSDKLSDEWLQIDIEPLSKIGFTKTHLEQLASQKILSPDVVQDSIHMFAFDLENTDKAKSFKKDAISFFMGILRKGSPYTPSENYEHPKSKAMRLYLECKRKEEQRREAMKQEIIDMAFKDWYSKLSDEEVKAMSPSGIKIENRDSVFAKGNAKNHFMKNILPTLKEVLEKCELQS